MKKSPKYVLKASMAACGIGGSSGVRPAGRRGEVHLDEESVALFAGIQESKDFTAEAAHRAFASVKRPK